MKNEFNNLKNLGDINIVEAYDILSTDTILDGKNYYVYVLTSRDGLTMTINEIIVPTSMSRVNFWSLTEQSQYHSQYEISLQSSRNCADRIKASKSLIILICSKNAAITILRRYPDGSINTKQPIIEETGLPGNWGSKDSTGMTIGLIEHT